MSVKPREGTGDDVALMGRVGEVVAFVLVDDQLGFNAEGFESVPGDERGDGAGILLADWAVNCSSFGEGSIPMI